LGREACVPIFLAGRRHGVRRRPSSPAPALRCFTIVAQERPQDLGYGYSKFSMAKKNFFDSLIYKFRAHNSLLIYHNNNNNNIAFFSQASWARLEMKPERNKINVLEP